MPAGRATTVTRMPEPSEPGDGQLTIDELAASVGMTVRNTRYYASLGLIPPPSRRGRVAYYGPEHRARLELVRALQQHGFTLQAIEGFLASMPADASVEEIALQKAMLTSWTPGGTEALSHAQLEERAGRSLDADDLRVLELVGSIQRSGTDLHATPSLTVGLELLGLDVPEEGMAAAGDAIRRHMEALVEDLTDILRTQVLHPVIQGPHTPEEVERLERTLPRLRQLTLEAVVAGFQQAANAVIRRSLARADRD